jgi:hypothetical protein
MLYPRQTLRLSPCQTGREKIGRLQRKWIYECKCYRQVDVLARLRVCYTRLMQQLNHVHDRLAELDARIARLKETSRCQTASVAFVTFETAEAVSRALKAYPPSYLSWAFQVFEYKQTMGVPVIYFACAEVRIQIFVRALRLAPARA